MTIETLPPGPNNPGFRVESAQDSFTRFVDNQSNGWQTKTYPDIFFAASKDPEGVVKRCYYEYNQGKNKPDRNDHRPKFTLDSELRVTPQTSRTLEIIKSFFICRDLGSSQQELSITRDQVDFSAVLPNAHIAATYGIDGRLQTFNLNQDGDETLIIARVSGIDILESAYQVDQNEQEIIVTAADSQTIIPLRTIPAYPFLKSLLRPQTIDDPLKASPDYDYTWRSQDMAVLIGIKY